MRGDILSRSHLSSLSVGRHNVVPTLPKLAPLERLPKRQRVGPSASLDEYRTMKLLREFITRKWDCQFNGIPRDHARGSLRPTQREERVHNTGKSRRELPVLYRGIIWIGGAPPAHGLVHCITFNGVRTAVRHNSRRQIGQFIGRVHHFRFQRDLVSDILAVRDLFDLPGAYCHLTPPNYAASVPRPEQACQ